MINNNISLKFMEIFTPYIVVIIKRPIIPIKIFTRFIIIALPLPETPIFKNIAVKLDDNDESNAYKPCNSIFSISINP